MSELRVVQYVGFETKGLVRQYTFSVREGAAAREFTIAIASEAFASHHARYQDAPDICSLKLQRELAAGDNPPDDSHYCLTDAELDDYRTAHLAKGKGLRRFAASRTGQIL
jgi:hypothetical protein